MFRIELGVPAQGSAPSSVCAKPKPQQSRLTLEADYQRERRRLAERRQAAFAREPPRPNQVWQLDFSDYGTTTGGIWPITACRDCRSKYEYGGLFRSLRFEAIKATHPELRHVGTRVRTPGQNGSRERGFGTMEHEWLIREEAVRSGYAD